jgi:hypothetical protein
MDCYENTGMGRSLDELKTARTLTFEQLRSHAKAVTAAKEHAALFKPTYKCAGIAEFDDNSKQVRLAREWHAKRLSGKYEQFRYSQIVDFEVAEDGATVANGGIGRAVVGGILFAGVGAIVGAATRKAKGFCYHLSVKVTVKDYSEPAFYITLIDRKTKKSSSEYSECVKAAQDLASKLQLVANEVSGRPSSGAGQAEPVAADAADQIRKFKQLLDDGIISQEEFDAKKRQLLNI